MDTRQRRRLEGRCVHCGKEPEPGKSRCKECAEWDNERQRAHRATSEVYKERYRQRLQVRREKHIALIGGRACMYCGEADWRCLDFHHTNPQEKEFGIAARMANAPLEELQAEVAKCVIVCANCHRKLHAEE